LEEVKFFFLLDVPVRERDQGRIVVFIWTHILRNVLTGVTVNQEFIFVARANQHPPAGQHPLDAPYESVVDEPQKS
jgi:hypothetical protein